MSLADDLRLVAISPDREDARDQILPQLAGLAAAGVTAYMFREKSLDDARFLELGLLVRKRCDEVGLTFILNERSELMEPLGARVVHLTWRSRALAEHGRNERTGRIFGKSVHALEEAETAAAAGHDYLVYGPIFATPSKEGLVGPQGLDGLSAVCAALRVPVVAVGGITAARAAACRGAGAAGLAVLRELTGDGAEERARELGRNWRGSHGR